MQTGANPQEDTPDTVVEPNPHLLECDGVIIDTETGEVLSCDLPEGMEEPKLGGDIPETFVNHVLLKITHNDARAHLAANNADEARLKLAAMDEKYDAMKRADPEYATQLAIFEQATGLASRHAKIVDGLKGFYSDTFGRFAEQHFSAKEKTWRSSFGTISCRTVPSRIAVTNAPNFPAIEKLAPQAVKKTVLVSKLPNDLKPEDVARLGLSVEPAHEKVSIQGAFKAGGAA